LTLIAKLMAERRSVCSLEQSLTPSVIKAARARGWRSDVFGGRIWQTGTRNYLMVWTKSVVWQRDVSHPFWSYTTS